MNNIGVRNGIHAGIAVVIIGTILHAIDQRLFLNSFGFAGYAVFLFFMIRSVRQTKQAEDGILPFGPAFVAALVPMTIGVFFSSAFQYAIHNWINPDIVELIKEVAVESATMMAEKMSEIFGMDVGEQEEMIKLLEEQDYRLSFGATFLSWFVTTLMGCVPALIIAAIMKRGEE